MFKKRIHRWIGLLLFVSVVSGITPEAVATPQRGISLEIVEKGVERKVHLYDRSYALVIGNDHYSDPAWMDLSNAVLDAEKVAQELGNRGFEVTLLKNLNSRDLRKALEEFVILKGEDAEARLFIWYAGHGHTINGEGYIVPTDAPNPEDNSARFRLNALSMRSFGRLMREAQSKHIMAVFDSCFSGTVFTSVRSRPPAVIGRAVTHNVRQFISSGGERQTVSDDGLFRKLFLDAITGADPTADANDDGFVLGSELGLYLHQKMTNLTENQQVPRSGKLRARGFDIGDFVFAIDTKRQEKTSFNNEKPAQTQTRTGFDPGQVELEFWNTIKHSKDAGLYKAYLSLYPKGSFSEIASSRIELLNANKKNQIEINPSQLTRLEKKNNLRIDFEIDENDSNLWSGTLFRNKKGIFIASGRFVNSGENNNTLFSQVSEYGEIRWQKVFGNSHLSTARVVAELDDKALIFVGQVGEASEFEPSRTSAWVFKTDKDGDLIWEKKLAIPKPGQEISSYVGGLFLERDNTLTVFGTTIESSTLHVDHWMAKLNEDGSLLWKKDLQLNVPKAQNYSIKRTTSGYTAYMGAGHEAACIVHLNRRGQYRWKNCFSNWIDKGSYLGLRILHELEDGRHIALGQIATGRDMDLFMITMDSSGKILRKKIVDTVASTSSLSGHSFTQNNTILAVGMDYSKKGHGWIGEIDLSGRLLWEKVVKEDYSRFTDVVELVNGNYLALGTKNLGHPTKHSKLWLYELVR